MHTYRYPFSFKLGRIVITAAAGVFLTLILTGIHSASASTQNYASCILQNCSFEAPSGAGSIPTGWKASGVKNASAATDTITVQDGSQSLWFTNTGRLRKVYQDVTASGAAGSTLTLSFWTKSLNASTNGKYRVFVVLYYKPGGSGKFYVNAPVGSHDWTQYTLHFTAKHDYKKVHVEIDFGKKGSAWFDDLDLTSP